MTDWSIDEFLGEYQTPTIEVGVCPRRDLVNEHARLDEELAKSRLSSLGTLAESSDQHDAAERLQELEDEIAAATRTFRFKALSRQRWRALMAEHAPDKEHKADGLDFNPETFPPVAISACSDAPAITKDQAARLVDTLPLGEFQKLWAAVLDVNIGVTQTPKSALATGILRMNGGSSTTAPPEESLGASS